MQPKQPAFSETQINEKPLKVFIIREGKERLKSGISVLPVVFESFFVEIWEQTPCKVSVNALRNPDGN